MSIPEFDESVDINVCEEVCLLVSFVDEYEEVVCTISNKSMFAEFRVFFFFMQISMCSLIAFDAFTKLSWKLCLEGIDPEP